MLRVANSTPIVDFDSKLNSFLVNLANKLLFPTPESPINTTETEHFGIKNLNRNDINIKNENFWMKVNVLFFLSSNRQKVQIHEGHT